MMANNYRLGPGLLWGARCCTLASRLGVCRIFQEAEGMVFDVEPMVLPSSNVGGEFIGKVPIAGLLSKLDAGAPYNG
jgi:hypothetical protein